MKNYRFLIVLVIINITGCVAAGVPYTSDPYKKIGYADDLYKHQNRALPADQLFVEAINTFESENDEKGLAISNRAYALFLISNSVTSWGKSFKKYGFHDKKTTFDSRYISAIKYLNHSLEAFSSLKVMDAPININFIIGRIYWQNLNDSKKACDFFNASAASYNAYKKASPSAKVVVPNGFKDYIDFISHIKEQVGCESA